MGYSHHAIHIVLKEKLIEILQNIVNYTLKCMAFLCILNNYVFNNALLLINDLGANILNEPMNR